MSKHHSFTDTVDQLVSFGVRKGILHLYTEDEVFENNAIRLKDRQVLNFGSCSYLGLEFDDRLREGAKQAIDRYGTQFSESRAYVSIRLYKELEHLLDTVFEAHCVITPTTTLGHIANVPIMVSDGDAVIMDHQLHNCVQTAVQLVKARGVYTEVIRHNRIDLLEQRILELRSKYRKIWYMADGIYSMYGDACPIDAIYDLMDRYECFHFYADDAHGMSIHGRNGKGFVLNMRHMHPKMVLATSLNKAFAAGGGVLVFPEKEAARKLRTCGGPLLSSGPMQPSGLGAAVAAAKIHLTPEIYQMQATLQDKLHFTRCMLEKYQLPVFSVAGAAVFFVGLSAPKLGYNMVERMLKQGYYVNLAIFPTVSLKNTGLRFTITRLHSYPQIEAMIATMAKELAGAMQEEGVSMEEIYKAFKSAVPHTPDGTNLVPGPKPEKYPAGSPTTNTSSPSKKPLTSLKVQQAKTIAALNATEWDGIFESKGAFNSRALILLERAFSNNAAPEEKWEFDYIVIRDESDKVILATFYTTTLWKDDMLSPLLVSRSVEKEREADPYFLTSRVLSTGSLLTEGQHLFIDFVHEQWKEGMLLLIRNTYTLQEERQAENIVLRDFHGIHQEVDDLLVENGFFRVTMPDTHIVPVNFSSPEAYLKSLPSKSRNQLRTSVLKQKNEFQVEVITGQPGKSRIAEWYSLYLNVKERGLELNTFALPENLFHQLAADDRWDILELSLPEVTHGPVAVLFSYRTETDYIPTIIGIDYTHNGEFNIYRQTLYHAIQRAVTLGAKNIRLGFTASMEKKKLGATAIATYAYTHIEDSFNLTAMEAIKGNT
ncbi:aminotransferase class I/II-fold pyridoxal phosphate-dependent enzyme [Flavihumibacter petaseus]|uniref:Putative acyltransferase n=1 Tax=Flavihumibacter petaseus NBRC 106054 TaxID=1220578 RepID=A0A0E9N615_9BACT|nr:GNAT family N-acetyltransferase [Flavihumibacter petaseus]GAO45248.1 putative acyltransferase [Flavihumibacter petaseus NBRC 106054]